MIQKKKCLLISQHFFPEEFIINDIVKSSKKIKYRILTAYPNYPNILSHLDYYKKFLKRKKKFNKSAISRVFVFPRQFNFFLEILLNYLSFIIFGILRLFFIKKNSYDFIFVYATSPLYQAIIGVVGKKLFKKKLVIWVQDLWPESLIYTGYIKNKKIIKVLNYLTNFIYESSDIILAQSQELKKKIQIRTKSKVVYLPNPTKDFFKKKKKFNDKSINLGYAGNFGKVQNLERIINIANKIQEKKIENINFHLIGDGSERKRLIKYAEKKNLKNIFFYNRLPMHKIKSFYEKMDILLINSNLKGNEAIIIPSKLQSYLSTKKPIISFCEGAVEKVIEDSKSGLNLSKKNITDSAKEIIKLSKNKKKILLFGKNGRIYYEENFKIHNIIKKLENIFISKL